MPFYSSFHCCYCYSEVNSLGNAYFSLAFFPGGSLSSYLLFISFITICLCGFQLILFSKSVFFFNYIRSSANIYIITSSQHFISFFWNSTGCMLTFSLEVLWPLTSVSYSLILPFPSSLPQWVPLEEPIQKPRSKETRLQFLLLNVSGRRGRQRHWGGKEKHPARWDIAVSIWGSLVFWLKTLFMIPL